jgi:hypothetical protein
MRPSTISVGGDVRDNARIHQNSNIVHGVVRDGGQVVQAGGNISWTNELADPTDLTKYIFSGKGPGRALAAFGAAFAFIGAAGWASIIFADMNARGPNVQSLSMFGDALPSGIPVGIVYFLGAGAGGIIAKIGASMARAGTQGKNTLSHLVITVTIIVFSIACLNNILAGAPLSTLTPHFATTGTDVPSKASR